MFRSRRRCIDSSKKNETKQSVKCPNGLCFAQNASFTLDARLQEKAQHCTDAHQPGPGLFSESTLYAPASPNNDRRLVEYRCNKNVCNRNAIIQHVEAFIDDYTFWNATSSDSALVKKQSTKNIGNTIRTSSVFPLMFFPIVISLYLL